MKKNEKPKGIVQFAMEWGVYMGLYFVVKFIFEVWSMDSFFCNAVALAMLLCVPVFVYFVMNKYHTQIGESCYFSQLWMMGIFLFFFTSLISSLAQYIYYVYINPDYIKLQFQSAVELMDAWGVMANDPSLLESVKEGLDKGNVPSPMSVVLERIWVNLFFGSLLSAAVAGLVRMRFNSKHTKQ
ncbi:MAG TPA: DUF4199 domain-containing protein [Candidatus Barnesiella excrementigallinarum]|nr:DUF4199 domain-containing protein [Candidatus Barnesiella excrementigallinarum]